MADLTVAGGVPANGASHARETYSPDETPDVDTVEVRDPGAAGATVRPATDAKSADGFDRATPDPGRGTTPRLDVRPTAPAKDTSAEAAPDPAASAARFGIEDYNAIREKFAVHGLSVDDAIVSMDRWIADELESTAPPPENWDAVVGAIRDHLGSRIEAISTELPDEPPAEGEPDMRWTINAELVDTFNGAAPLLYTAKAQLLRHSSPEFRAAIDESPAALRYGLRLDDAAEVLDDFVKDSDHSELPNGLLGAPGFFSLNGEQIRSDGFMIAGLHDDLAAFRGNPVRAYMFDPKNPIQGLTFLSAEDQRIEQEAMVYYLAAAGLQAAPYVGAAPGLAADVRDIFSSNDATLSYLKEAGLIDPRYHIEKESWEHAAAAAGVLLTVAGAQALTRLPKFARAAARLGPNGGARVRVAMRQLSNRIMGRRAPLVERLGISDTVRRLADAGGHPQLDVTREMFSGLHQLKPRDADFLRAAERRLAEGQPLPREDATRVNEILRRLVTTPAAKRRPPVTIQEAVDNPELLRGRNPGEVRGLLGLEDSYLWQPGNKEWSASHAESGLHLEWNADSGWTHRVGDETTRIPAETRPNTAPLFIRPTDEIPDAYRARVEESGLPVIDGGQLTMQGSRTASGHLASSFDGYHRFVMPDGRRVFSLDPIEGDAFGALDAVRRFERHTGRTDIMAKPLGIHFVDGKPRLIFEDLGGTKLPSSWNQLTPDQQRFFSDVLSPETLDFIRRNGIDSQGRTLETDYLFTMPDGSVRMGLPVRVSTFNGVLESYFRAGPAVR